MSTQPHKEKPQEDIALIALYVYDILVACKGKRKSLPVKIQITAEFERNIRQRPSFFELGDRY